MWAGKGEKKKALLGGEGKRKKERHLNRVGQRKSLLYSRKKDDNLHRGKLQIRRREQRTFSFLQGKGDFRRKKSPRFKGEKGGKGVCFSFLKKRKRRKKNSRLSYKAKADICVNEKKQKKGVFNSISREGGTVTFVSERSAKIKETGERGRKSDHLPLYQMPGKGRFFERRSLGNLKRNSSICRKKRTSAKVVTID